MTEEEFTTSLTEILTNATVRRPLGSYYFYPHANAPEDSLICNGATYSRKLYKDFFEYIKQKGLIKPEADWQAIAQKNNGYCSWYSDGDGETTFRVPKFAPFIQITNDSTNAGNYHLPGIPNITGEFKVWNGSSSSGGLQEARGAFYAGTKYSGNTFHDCSGGGWDRPTIAFRASNCSPVFGRSGTVQPESQEWVVCVVVLGSHLASGGALGEDATTTLAHLQERLDTLEKRNPVAHLVETWTNNQGNWFRKWSDGWIEQGGIWTSQDTNELLITLNKPMATTNYHCTVTSSWIQASQNGTGYCRDKTNSNFRAVVVEPNGTWKVCGY